MKIYISDKLSADNLEIIKKDFPKGKIVVTKNFFADDNHFIVEKKSKERFMCKIDSFAEVK